MYIIYDPRYPEHRWNCHDGGMKTLFGLRPEDKWPREGMAGRQIQGVWVWVRGLEDARRLKQFIRVRALCPGCGKELSASRLHQHVCKE